MHLIFFWYFIWYKPQSKVLDIIIIIVMLKHVWEKNAIIILSDRISSSTWNYNSKKTKRWFTSLGKEKLKMKVIISDDIFWEHFAWIKCMTIFFSFFYSVRQEMWFLRTNLIIYYKRGRGDVDGLNVCFFLQHCTYMESCKAAEYMIEFVCIVSLIFLHFLLLLYKLFVGCCLSM